MTHYDGFDTLVSESSHLNMALLCVRDSEHAVAFAIQGAKTIWVVARIQTVDQGQIGKVVHICFNSKDDDHATNRGVIWIFWSTYTSLRSLTALTSLPKESSPMHFNWWSSHSITLLLGHLGQRPPPTRAKMLHLKSISTIPMPPSRSKQKVHQCQTKSSSFLTPIESKVCHSRLSIE